MKNLLYLCARFNLVYCAHTCTRTYFGVLIPALLGGGVGTALEAYAANECGKWAERISVRCRRIDVGFEQRAEFKLEQFQVR